MEDNKGIDVTSFFESVKMMQRLTQIVADIQVRLIAIEEDFKSKLEFDSITRDEVKDLLIRVSNIEHK